LADNLQNPRIDHTRSLAVLAPLASSADAGCLRRHLRIRAVGTTDMAHCIACRSNSQRSIVRSPVKIKSPPQSSGGRLEVILERAKLNDVALAPSSGSGWTPTIESPHFRTLIKAILAWHVWRRAL